MRTCTPIVATHQIWGPIEFNLGRRSTEPDSWSQEFQSQILEKLRDVTMQSESSPSWSLSKSLEPADDSGNGRTTSVIKLNELMASSSTGKLASTLVDGDGDEKDERPGVGSDTYSVGSKYHDLHKCRPCHYVGTKYGCSKGAECSFCHLDHCKLSRPRPGKVKREKCRIAVSKLDEMELNDPELLREADGAQSHQLGYLKKMMKCRLRHLQERVEHMKEQQETPSGDQVSPRCTENKSPRRTLRSL